MEKGLRRGGEGKEKELETYGDETVNYGKEMGKGWEKMGIWKAFGRRLGKA